MSTMSAIVIVGQWFVYYNMVMPGTVGPYWQNITGLLTNLGAVFFGFGTFVFVVLTTLSKRKLIPEGNPFLHESKIYEYPL